MTEPTDDELDAVIAEYRTRIYPQDMHPRFERAIMRAAIAKWGTPPAVAPWRSAVLDLIDECPGLTMEQDRWLSRRVKELDFASTPQPTQAQAGAVPLDEARRLFDAGWKAAALFCDREDVVADGIIGFGACPQFEAAFTAAHGIKGGQHGAE